MDYIRNVRLKDRLTLFFASNYNHPLETVALIVHYKFASLVFFGLFTAIVSSFYAADPMECILKYDRSKPPYEFEELCLTYPYTYREYGNRHWSNRVFALHYKWIHWSMLFLVGAYHLPLFIRKYHENKDLNLYLTVLRNDDSSDLRKHLVSDFVHNFLYTQQSLHKKQLITLLWLMLIDVGSFWFFDIVLQNRFARLIPFDYPFAKWPQYFNDTMSIAFPQFVECTIGEDMMIISRRKEELGCRLTLMPLYEKVFIILWFMFVLLFIIAALTFLYYCLLGMSKKIRRSLIYIVREEAAVKYCVEHLTSGDILALNCLRRVVPSDLYRHALRETQGL